MPLRKRLLSKDKKPIMSTNPRIKRPSRLDKATRLLTQDDFWQSKTLEQLAAEQGIRPIARLEEVLGRTGELWKDDADVDAFLLALRERRQKGE